MVRSPDDPALDAGEIRVGCAVRMGRPGFRADALIRATGRVRKHRAQIRSPPILVDTMTDRRRRHDAAVTTPPSESLGDIRYLQRSPRFFPQNSPVDPSI